MKKLWITIVTLFLLVGILSAQEKKYTPTPENMKSREWFQDAKFGLFIHWGVYSVLGDGEWVMNNQQIPIKTYEKLTAFFNPTEFNPAEWVKLAKDEGMKYITITSKHHDGFAMFDSKVSDYNMVKKTLPEVKLADVDGFVKGYVKEDNRVVIITGPEKEGLKKVTEQEVLQALKVNSNDVKPYVETELAKGLLRKEVKPGKVVKKEFNANIGATNKASAAHIINERKVRFVTEICI